MTTYTTYATYTFTVLCLSQAAAARELQEETSVDPSSVPLIQARAAGLHHAEAADSLRFWLNHRCIGLLQCGAEHYATWQYCLDLLDNLLDLFRISRLARLATLAATPAAGR